MGVPRIGVWAWSFVGVVAATIIVVAALAAVSEIVPPLTFAVVGVRRTGQVGKRGADDLSQRSP
jgi:hypothetical protein